MPNQRAGRGPDDESSSDRTSGAVPLPDDRLWRHPTEFAAEQRRRGPVGADAPSAASPFAVAAVSVLGGGLLITGLWLAIGSTRTSPVGGAEAAVPGPEVLDTAGPVPSSTGSFSVELRSPTAGITTGIAIVDGPELITAIDAEPGERLDAKLPDGRHDIATVVGHDELTGLTAVRLHQTTVAGAHLGPATGRLLTTVDGDGGWSHAVSELESRTYRLGDPVIADGMVDGVVTALDGASAQVTSIEVAARVAAQLFSTGETSHPWLGIEGRDGDGSAVITAVVESGPAAMAGLAPGDLITGIGELAVASMADLLDAVRAYSPGDTVVLAVRTRTGAERVSVELAAIDDA